MNSLVDYNLTYDLNSCMCLFNLSIAESEFVEEVIYCLQFFLCPKDCGARTHICVLLRSVTCNCYGS